jgi:hypothetical protein
LTGGSPASPNEAAANGTGADMEWFEFTANNPTQEETLMKLFRLKRIN